MKKKIGAMTGLSVRQGMLLFGLWILVMAVLTRGTAEFIFRDLSRQGLDLGTLSLRAGGFQSMENLPGALEYGMHTAIARMPCGISAPSFDGYPVLEQKRSIFRDTYHTCDTFTVFLDPEGNVLRQSGDFIYFGYQTAEDMAAGKDTPSGYGWLDLSDEEDPRYLVYRSQYAGTRDLHDMKLRITGYWDGSRLEPLAMVLNGDVRFDDTDQAPADREIVTVYVPYPDMTLYEPQGPVRYRGVRYENLGALMEDNIRELTTDRGFLYGNPSQFDLRDLVVFSDSGFCPDPADENRILTVLTVMQADPVAIAMGFLRNIYIVSFLLTVLGFFWLRRVLRRQLILPLQQMEAGMAAGWTHIRSLQDHPPRWREPGEIWEQYRKNQDTLRQNRNEITRLEAAVRFAETAEKNRRQMTSNIAHELKTPLAVIHSYAEGLKENIAEEKREKYMDVILEEAERTDRMVLEMLDLSRLEAGKIRLSRDEFSPVELTKSAFQKLKMAADARGLRTEFSFPADFTVTADECRIGEVIENFVSNAVKYTVDGGLIRVKLRQEGSGFCFVIENEAPPLPAEAIPKIWDSFYRADHARTGSGTGLGLAIAKNIIILHGGSCGVRNTETGVEFRFTI